MTPTNSPFRAGDKVVGYCRYSGGEEQGLKNTSTDEQETAIRQFCEQNNLILVKVYADPFVSGRSVQGRDHYLEMLSFLLHTKKTDIAGVVLWDYERYGRNYDQATLDAARLRMAGYKIFSLQQPITDTSPFAKVMEAMYMASAQNQSDMISADVRRALQNNFKKYKAIPRSVIPAGWIAVPVDMGKFSNGTERIGYKAEPDPELAPRIREAIEARFHGATLDEMKVIIGSKLLNKHKVYIKRLMKRPLLFGQMRYGETTMDNYCEPIIDKETYDNLQIYNKHAPQEHEQPKIGRYSKNRALLSGMLYCGVCGRHAYLDSRKAKGHTYETYYCNDKHIGYRKQLLNDLVIEKSIELLSDEKYQKDVEYVTKGLQNPFESGINKVLTTSEEIEKIDRKIARISSAIEESDDAPITLVKRLSELEKERSVLMSELTSDTNAEAREQVLEETNRLRLSILEVLKNEKSTTDELRNALSLFISAVVIYPENKVAIRYTLPGFANVASNTSGEVTAPPEDVSAYSQLLEIIFIV